MSSSRARHRAPSARFAWASRALLTAATVPVGALAGCVVAAVSSSADRPEMGLAGLALAAVPLGVHGWRLRSASAPLRGRHAAGVAEIWPDAEVLEARGVAAAPSPASAPVAGTSVVLTAALPAAGAAHPRPVPRQRGVNATAQQEAAPVRVFTVSADRQVVEVVPGARRDVEIAELQRMWDSGTGPDTGALVPVPATHAA